MSARLQHAAETCERIMPGFVAGMMRASGLAATPGLPGVVQAVREATRCQAVYVDASMVAGDFGEPVVFGDEVLWPDTKAEVCAAMSARLGVPVAPGDTLVDIAGRVERHKAAMRRFRRAMRRHEDRARRMGASMTARAIRDARLSERFRDEAWFRESASLLRPRPTDRRTIDRDYGRRVAYLYSLAADAAATLDRSTQ